MKHASFPLVAFLALSGTAHAQVKPLQTFGDWQLICDVGSFGAYAPSGCALGVSLESSDMPERTMELSFYKSASGRLAFRLLTEPEHEEPARLIFKEHGKPSVMYAPSSWKCADNACESGGEFSLNQKNELIASHELKVVIPLPKDMFYTWTLETREMKAALGRLDEVSR